MSHTLPNLFCRRCQRPVCCRTMPLVRSKRCVLSLPMWCTISGDKTRSYPPQSSLLNCLHSVLPSVFITNCSMSASVCLPTQAARINPLELARLKPIQQSPASSSWAQHCFCFLRQMTTSHPHSPPPFVPLGLRHCEPIVLFDWQHEQYWLLCYRQA